MQVVVIPLVCMMMGAIFVLLTDIMPIFQKVFFHWFGFIFACAGSIYLIYRLVVTQTLKHADRPNKGKHLINYLRRDNEVVPVEGIRAYPGESFIDVQGLGLVEFLGKDCYYTWGDKKVIWGLENINFTPDPRYFNLTHLLWELGFTDSVDVYNVLNGLDLELMGRVYLHMKKYDNGHGSKKLVSDLKEYDGPVVDFEPVKTVGDRVDDLLKNKKVYS